MDICWRSSCPRIFNRRTDEYGGSLENRARIWLEGSWRPLGQAVGQDCAIAVRSCHGRARRQPNLLRLRRRWQLHRSLADDLVDLWDVNIGSLLEWPARLWRIAFLPGGLSARVHPSTLARATEQADRGCRALDQPRPDGGDSSAAARWTSLAGLGRRSPIRSYLGRLMTVVWTTFASAWASNACTGRSVQGGHIGCAQNATAGEEYRRGLASRSGLGGPIQITDKDMLVVGAGPSGMECAMVLGKREMVRVHLVEASSEMGGCVRWISQLPGLGEWSRITNYRRIQIDKLKNVELIAGKTVDCADVLEYGADLVVIATGSSWSTDGLNCATSCRSRSGRREAQLPDAGADPSRGQGLPGAKSPCLRLRRLLRRAERRGTLERRGAHR